MKRAISLLLVLATLCGLLAVPTFAATTAFDKLTTTKYAQVFTLSASGKTIPYTNKNLNTRGTESYGASSGSYIDNRIDEIYLMDVGCTNGRWWAYVQYPSGAKKVKAYIYLSSITSNNGTHAKGTSSGKFYCSLRANTANSTKYYVAKGDTVYLIATSGSKHQIMYPAGSVWRIAWCNASDYNKYVGKTQPIANGIYTIASAVGNNQMVDVCGGSQSNGGNIWLWEKNGQAPQDFEFAYHSGGYYTIKNVGSGLYIDVAGGSNALGTNIQQYQGNGTNAQKWYLEDAGNEYYYLRSALGRYFDVEGGRADSGTNIRLWDGNGSNAQKFKFIPKNSSAASTQSVPAASPNCSMTNVLYGINISGSKLSCGFDGYVSLRHKYGWRHEGIDFQYSKNEVGKEVYSLTDGVVTNVKSGTNGLSTVAIYYEAQDKTVVYLHLTPTVTKGVKVVRGTKIGTESNRGTDAVHTHVEVRDGKQTGAQISSDTVLKNGDPTRFWNSLGYTVK